MTPQQTLAAGMARAKIGKAWQRRAKRMMSKDFPNFLEKARRKGLHDAQWKEAYGFYTAMRVAELLHSK